MNIRAGMVAFGLSLLVGFTGCGSGPVKPASEKAAAEAPKPPATPDAAVNQVTKGLLDNKPQVVWQSLPASYQKDVSGLLTAFANSCDPDVYNQSFQLVKKVGMIFKNKKELIAATHPLVGTPEHKPKEVADSLDQISKAIDTVVTSELGDISKIKALDVEKLLSTTGAQLMTTYQEAQKSSTDGKGLTQRIQSLKATVVKQDGDTATVKMEGAGEAPKEQQFVRVEGHWIPKDMADSWKADIAKAKKTIEESVSKTKTQNKDKTLSQLKMVDAVLDQMLAAKTKEELNVAMQSGMMAGMGLMMSLQQAASEAGGGLETPPPPPGGVK